MSKFKNIEELEKAYKELEVAFAKKSQEIKQLETSDASKEQSSIDYYCLYKELKTKNKSLKERLSKSVELPCKVGDKAWYVYVAGEYSCIHETYVTHINLNDIIEVRFADTGRRIIFFTDGSVKEVDWSIYLTRSEAEDQLKRACRRKI